MTNATFQRETYESIIAELEPVLPVHYRELALDQDDIPLDPDYTVYKRLQDLGELHIFSARIDGELVGYIIGTIRPHIHYRSSMHYFNDIYYVLQEHRNNGVGARFFKAHEKELLKLGVIRSVMFTKLHQSHELLFKALGYKQQDIVMTKVL